MKLQGIHRRQDGVTLIELMITVSIAAILLGVGIPAMSSMLETNRRTAVVNELVSSLHLARASAYLDQSALPPGVTATSVVVCPRVGMTCVPGNDWSSGWLVFRDIDGDAVVDAGEQVLGQADASPNGIDLQSTATLLRYRRNRGAQAGTLTVCVTGGGAQSGRNIVIGIAGYPRLTTTDCP